MSGSGSASGSKRRLGSGRGHARCFGSGSCGVDVFSL